MIREANKKDLEDILEIYNDAILNTTSVYDYKSHTLDNITKWYEKKKREGYPLLVFEEHNKAVGFATFGEFRTWPAYKYTIEHSVYVHKNHRNKGIGIKLMIEIIRIASERGYVTLVAGIDAENESSIKMHKKLGFQFSGVIKKAGFKFDKWLDLAFYQLDLTQYEENHLNMKLELANFTESHAKQICGWRYSGEYSVYNYPDWDTVVVKNWGISIKQKRQNEFMAVINEQDELCGYIRLINQIDCALVGIGLKPALCGIGLGNTVMKLIKYECNKRYGNKKIVLEVRSFNERAIKCYKKAGFNIVDNYEKNTLIGKDKFLRMEL